MTEQQNQFGQGAIDFIYESFPVGPLACNCTIIGNPITKTAMVVDPGGDAQLILERLTHLDLRVVSIVHTHAHLDHFLASGEMKKTTGAELCLHPDDAFLWNAVDMQCQMLGLPSVTMPGPDIWMKDDFALALGDGVAIHTPGHTPGSMSFYFNAQRLLLAGDTLFQGSIGRTDLPGGNYQQIERSIKQRLYTLGDDVTVITGHGPETSIGNEKMQNMFIKA